MQKEAWMNSESLESHAFGKFKSFIKRQLYRSLSSLWPTVLFVPLANLSQDPPLRCACTPQPKWTDLKAFGRRNSHYGPAFPLTFVSQVALLCMCSVSLVPRRRGAREPLILYSDRILPLFVLATTIVLRYLQKTKSGYLLCFYCYFHFGEQTEGWF